MKRLILIFSLLFLVACDDNPDKQADPTPENNVINNGDNNDNNDVAEDSSLKRLAPSPAVPAVVGGEARSDNFKMKFGIRANPAVDTTGGEQ